MGGEDDDMGGEDDDMRGEDDDMRGLALNVLSLISRSTTPVSCSTPRHAYSVDAVTGDDELPRTPEANELARTRGARRSNYARMDDPYKSLLVDTELLE